MAQQNTIFKILTNEQYQSFVASGVFEGAPVDFEDGFIHFSNENQVQETGEKHFSQYDEIWILKVKTDRFGDHLKWETSRGGDLFPHLYNLHLQKEDVVESQLYRNIDGRFDIES